MFKKILIILMLAAVANASNFGSSAIDTVSVKQNQSGEFNLLFWTTDNETQSVILNIIKTPDDFSVRLEKERVDISVTQGNEMVYAQGYIAATSVKVFFEQNAKPGKHNIIISATKMPLSGEIVFAQERIFNLTVIVEGRSNVINIDIPEIEPPHGNYNFIIVILVIIFISYMIYRYS